MISPEAIHDFKGKNQQRYTLQRNLTIGLGYALIDDKDLPSIFGAKDSGCLMCTWSHFYERFPGTSGILELSRVGFNNSRDQALIYVGHLWGGKEGRGSIFLLAKKAGIWSIIQTLGLWDA